MTDGKIIIQEVAASFDLVDPGISLEDAVKIPVDLEHIISPVKRVIHPCQFNATINILIAEAITEVGVKRKVFPGSISFKIIKSKVGTGTTKLEGLIQGNDRRDHPGSFLLPVDQCLAKQADFLPGDLIIGIFNR